MILQPESKFQKTLIQNVFVDASIGQTELQSLSKVNILVGNLHIKDVFSRKMPSLSISKLDGNLMIEDCKFLWKFPNLKNITGNIIIKNSFIAGFENLSNVMGDFKLKNSTIVHLHNLKKIGGNLVLDNSDIVHLLALEAINKNLYMQNSTIVHATELRYLNGKEFVGEVGISITKSPQEKQEYGR